MSRSAYSFPRAFLFFRDVLFEVSCAVLAVVRFIVTGIPVAALHAWRAAVPIGLAAVRMIGRLKPVYRDSYRTHGLSLYPRLRC